MMEVIASAAHLHEDIVANNSHPTSVAASSQGAKRKAFKKDLRMRNKANKRKLTSLQKKLTDWYEETKLPTIALTLLKTKSGQLVVKYSGPVEFQMFGQNKEVQRVFHACVKEGLSKSNGTLEEQAEQMMEHSEEEVDERVVALMINKSFAHFGLDDKRKLLSDIVRGTGAAKKQKWSEAAKPVWWPEEVDFRSPNERKLGYSMSVDEIDKVLYTYSSFLKCISNMNGYSNAWQMKFGDS